MKTLLILVGKTDRSYTRLLADYVERINHYMSFEVEVVRQPKNTKSMSAYQQNVIEGEAVLKLIQPSDNVVLLDEQGGQLSSLSFASWLGHKRLVARRLVFIIGGPYGFSSAVYSRCNERLSLSRMTFSHQMVRIIFAEQLYRACTIIRGEPYHHG